MFQVQGNIYDIAIRRLGSADVTADLRCSGCCEALSPSSAPLVRFGPLDRDERLWFHRPCFEHLLMGLEAFDRRVLAPSDADPVH
jgi:hypothetical protein